MFAKIFTQIFDSSIVENPEVRFTFMDLLVLADRSGVVDMTHEAIARRTNRPIEVIRATILILESPDSSSRTPDDEGRRLKRLDEHRDWGWLITNYDQFRKIASEEQRREKTLDRVTKHRDKIRGKSPCNAPVTHGNAVKRMKRHAEAEAEAEALSKRSERNFPEVNGNPTLNEVKSWAQRDGLAEWRAVDWFNEMEGCGWIDHNHRPIKNAQAVLSRIKEKWEADGRPMSPPVSNGYKLESKANGANTVVLGKEYERVLERIKVIKSQYEGHQEWSVGDKVEIRELKSRRDELKTILKITI